MSCRSGLSPHAAELVQLGSDAEGVRFGPPTRNRHYTGFHKFQTLEETSDLLDAAQAVRDRANLVPDSASRPPSIRDALKNLLPNTEIIERSALTM